MNSLKVAFLAIFTCYFLVQQWHDWYSNKLLKLYYLDIGQGDAILIVSPDNKSLLVDTGRDSTVIYQLGEIIPFWQKNIDRVIITHSDGDHINGLYYLLKHFNVQSISWNDQLKSNTTIITLQQMLQDQGVTVTSLDSHDDFVLGCCVQIDVLWPEPDTKPSLSENDRSISFILRYNGFTAFFGGDLSHDIEERISEQCACQADVLKVGHHGSKTSSSKQFLHNLAPEIAIISVGAENDYGHPDPQVLHNFAEADIKVFRTDLLGNILVKSDGNSYQIEHRDVW